jgi:undecaprenyl-diphosphatase
MINTLLRWDEFLFVMINQKGSHASLDGLMSILSSSKTFVPFYVLGIVLLVKHFGKKAGIPILIVVLSFALADSISARVFKPVFKRVRPAFEAHLHARLPEGPPGGRHGFVSSHSANAFAVYPLLLGVIFYRKGRRMKNHKTWFWLHGLVLFVVFWIAYSRVYLGFHYVGDVFFGALLGAGIGYGLWWWYTQILYEKFMETPQLS